MELMKLVTFGLVVTGLPLEACPARRTARLAPPLRTQTAIMRVSSSVGMIIDEQTMTATATVQAIDSETHVITLRRPDGTIFTIALPPNSENMFAIVAAPGMDGVQRFEKDDQVSLVYRKWIAFEVKKPDQSIPGVANTTDVSHNPSDEKPGGTMTDTIDVRMPITAIDKAASAVTVRDVSGAITVMPVPDPSTLDAVAVGDVMDIRYTTALTITVQKHSRRSAPSRSRDNTPEKRDAPGH